MSIRFRLLIGVLACMFSAFVHGQATPLCRYADDRCTEWVPLGNDQRGLIYRTFALNQRNEGVEHAVVVIHGQGRNADGYFRHA